jgi:pSer/pThr/pTyr-binding forkhead associated (FHA) protein
MPLRTSSIHGVSIPCLVPLTTSGTRPPIILADSSIVIGSGDAAQIRLKSLSVSKAHALVLVDDGTAYVRDLASRTELFVNDVAVREAVLKHGDVLRVGKFGFGVTEDPAVAQVQRPRAVAPTALLRVGDEAELRRVSEPVVLIGRRARCDITLADDSLSGAHAVMFRIGRRWFLRDLSSRTGTIVNGDLIRQQRGLEDGDLIRVGRVDIRFVGEERINGSARRSDAASESASARAVVPPAEAVAMTSLSSAGGVSAAPGPSKGVARGPVGDRPASSVPAAETNGSPEGAAATPVVTAETSQTAESMDSMALGDHDIFGMGTNTSAAPVPPDASDLTGETPLLGLHGVGTAAENVSQDSAWDTDHASRSETEADAVQSGVAASQVRKVADPPAEFTGPVSLTFSPKPERGTGEASEPAREADVGRRIAGAEATDEEWDESVAVWSFEDLARRASADDGEDERDAEDGGRLIWVAVAVGVACLGVIAWLVVFKLR